MVVSGGSFSTWAVAEATKLPPVGLPGAPPPEAAEENVRTSGGRGVAKSARRSHGEAAGAAEAAEAAEAVEAVEAAELRDGVALIAALCACWQAQTLFA